MERSSKRFTGGRNRETGEKEKFPKKVKMSALRKGSFEPSKRSVPFSNVQREDQQLDGEKGEVFC